MNAEDLQLYIEENSFEYIEHLNKPKKKKRSGWYDEHNELDYEDKNDDTKTDRE